MNTPAQTSKQTPDQTQAQTASQKNGFFGSYGGSHVPPELAQTVESIAEAYARYSQDPDFQTELNYYLKNFVGRESPLFYAANLSRKLGGAKIYLKREDLNHLGAHKVNNTVGQALLAKRMGKHKLIAETGAGQHGVATAATAALFGMSCTVYMGSLDVERQYLNVERMRMLGAEVVAVNRGNAGLKEAVDAALEAWVADPEIFYVIGSAVGPHPYPLMVRDFQSVIGKEARRQILEAEGRLPDYCLACVGGGSNAIGLFHPFAADTQVKLVGVEPGGRGNALGEHAATLNYGKPGVLHGSNSYFLQDDNGEVAPVHSISAGLDYPGVGPEHSFLKDSGRATYVTASDQDALDAFQTLCRNEGIIPALESSHALAQAIKLAPTLNPDQIIVVCLSGRGDKDMEQLTKLLK
ncbi:MAG: tryptophan synthase subunit beta [Deltaproteobacteria bacterium]|jgi:tryptophan synthase beta subunit|nr:tryptophan synthase subunit beta [Deltaproteobacteria bacterium]